MLAVVVGVLWRAPMRERPPVLQYPAISHVADEPGTAGVESTSWDDYAIDLAMTELEIDLLEMEESL